MTELKPIDQLLEEDRQAKIAAFNAMPLVGDLVRKHELLLAVKTYAADSFKTSSRSRYIVEEMSDSQILKAIDDAVSAEDAIECALEEAECCMEYQTEIACNSPSSWSDYDGHHCNEDL